MLTNLLALLRYFFIWIIFFFLERIVFLLYFRDKIKGASVPEILKSFGYGIRIDASAAAYVCVLPLLVFVILWNFSFRNFSSKVLRYYTLTFVVVSALLTVINLNIYREWGSKLNYRAFEFALASPGEALASSESSPLLFTFFVLALLITAGFFLFKNITGYKLQREGFRWYKIPLSLLFLGLAFLAIRGGWQLSPINESMAYYSERPILNHATINTEWAFIHSVKSGISADKHPFKYFKKDEALGITRELYPPAEAKPVRMLKTARPNIVMVIMESFTADVVESLGGVKGVDPGIEKLIPEGILFQNIYSTGDRTDKGVIGVLSAFPSQAMRSIIKENTKHKDLPSLYRTFSSQGYNTSFFYGGESQFTNMKSYLLSNGCKTLVDKYDFDKKDMNSKWGAYDGTVYERQLAELAKEKSPFFSTILTLTNHEPFELPVKAHFPGETLEEKFKSTAYYADSCLAAFIAKAKTQKWYENTLFIIVADHGHRLPKNQYEIYDVNRYRIPLLFLGGAIKEEYRGKKISKIGGQTDIAATLLDQLGLPSSEFNWSKDLLDPGSADFAFYSWNDGFGFINRSQAISYDIVSGKAVFKSNDTTDAKEEERIRRYSRAYMQAVYQRYLDY